MELRLYVTTVLMVAGASGFRYKSHGRMFTKMNRLSDATLNGMTKKQLIEYVRMCEHNYDIAEETLRQQAENVKDWRPVKRGKWSEYSRNALETYIECTNCCVASRPIHLQMVTRDGSGLPDFCPNCGAEMCGGDADV